MISAVIPVLNNQDELIATVDSIRSTTKPGQIEIVVVDDMCSTPVQHYVSGPDIKIVTNRHSIGVGPSRHLGVCAASNELIMLCDAHMRFPVGWAEKITARAEARPTTIHCCTCAGLEWDNADLANPIGGYYNGATLNVYGPDLNKSGKFQVFEPTWLPKEQEPADDDQIPCLMGASYVMYRDWFLKLSVLRFLRRWGSDEIMLSMASYLAGGDVRIFKEVKIGHIFWTLKKGTPKKRFSVPTGVVVYNKIFSIKTLLGNNTGLADHLIKLMDGIENQSNYRSGLEMIKNDWHIIATERERLQRLFVHSWGWYFEKFGIAVP